VSSAPSALFAPLAVREVVFRNRILVSPMCQYSATDGLANEWHFAHHARFALGGVGGAVVEATAVTRDGRITPGCLGIWSEAHIEPLKRVTALYRAQGIPVGIQLAHAGRKGSAATPRDGAVPLLGSVLDAPAWTALAPSPIALMEGWPQPKAATETEVVSLISAFAKAADRAVRAGFDFVEIHGAHGYLIHSFLAPASNCREDDWGGDQRRRFRFALEVVEAVRGVVPPSMPVFYRSSAADVVADGLSFEDHVALGIQLAPRGVDVIDCSAGGIAGPSGRAPVAVGPGYLVPYARKTARTTGLLTMATGLIDSPRLAAEIIDGGDVALLAIGRQLLAEPSFAYRAAVELGHPKPESLLPPQYALFLERKRKA